MTGLGHRLGRRVRVRHVSGQGGGDELRDSAAVGGASHKLLMRSTSEAITLAISPTPQSMMRHAVGLWRRAAAVRVSSTLQCATGAATRKEFSFDGGLSSVHPQAVIFAADALSERWAPSLLLLLCAFFNPSA